MNLVVTGIHQSSHQLDTLWTSKVQDTLPTSLTAAFFAWKDDIHWPVHQDQRATRQLTRETSRGTTSVMPISSQHFLKGPLDSITGDVRHLPISFLSNCLAFSGSGHSIISMMSSSSSDWPFFSLTACCFPFPLSAMVSLAVSSMPLKASDMLSRDTLLLNKSLGTEPYKYIAWTYYICALK